MGISGVGSFPVWSGGSLIIFQLLRCRNLAFNRFFLLFLVTGMLLYWGCLDAPMFVCPLYIHMPPRVQTPPICLYTPLHLYVLRGFCMFWGVVGGPLHVGHLHYLLDTPVWVSPHMS